MRINDTDWNNTDQQDGVSNVVRIGLYAVTVSTAQRHPYDGYRTRTVES
jgi:hypothetical protein